MSRSLPSRVQDMKAISAPIRLIPQTAQPIDFACPLCGTVHAAYYFSSARCKIYRCGGCGLTFSSPAAPWSSDDSAASKPQRSEQQHRALMALLADRRASNALVFADRDDSVVALLQRMNISAHVVSDDDEPRGTT